jgi:AcrR family transcriptional regulator
MVNMRSGDAGALVGPAEITTRARIRDAAVLRFARTGFGASVRAIAADAAVSPGLVIHHFGSKQGLHAACDDFVLARIAEAKRQNMSRATTGGLIEVLAQADDLSPLLSYVLRSLQAGGPAGKAFVEHMIADAEQYTAEAVGSGIVKPSRDERARVRYLVLSTLGTLLLSVTFDDAEDVDDVSTAVKRFLEDLYLPMLELFTEGFLTTRRMLDDYLLYVGDPPDTGSEGDGFAA